MVDRDDLADDGVLAAVGGGHGPFHPPAVGVDGVGGVAGHGQRAHGAGGQVGSGGQFGGGAHEFAARGAALGGLVEQEQAQFHAQFAAFGDAQARGGEHVAQQVDGVFGADAGEGGPAEFEGQFAAAARGQALAGQGVAEQGEGGAVLAVGQGEVGGALGVVGPGVQQSGLAGVSGQTGVVGVGGLGQDGQGGAVQAAALSRARAE
ncbi:hypothetical protein [Nocardiopsis sp. CNR-923]|uniref:hypothetical protein n=1 Tax=Nocardiopsis sp. CNR-923 TaxID=1904965 RepID=UPI0021CCCDEE|nr:hypothetical protein [Nocardiopsis sp. CNR-923]